MNGAEGRFYAPLVACLTLLLLSCAAALSILMLAKAIGPFRFYSVTPAEMNLSFGLWTPRSGTSSASANRVRAWREIAPPDRELLESFSLAKLQENRVRSIAIPDARAMGPREIGELRAYLDGGGGVVLTGSVAVTGPDGLWRGYEQMSSLLRVKQIVQLDREASTSIAVSLRGPLSASLSPGRRIALIPETGMTAIASEAAELTWDRFGSGAAASRRVAVGRGRMVWLAAGPENASSESSESWVAMLLLLRSAIAWSAGLPSLEVLAWPGGAAYSAELKSVAPGDPAFEGALGEERLILEEIERARLTGGLARLPIASASKEDPTSLLPSTISVALERLRQGNAWIARPDEVGRWSEIQRAFRVTLRLRGPRRVQVDVTNRSAEPAVRVVLRLHVNRKIRQARISKTQILQGDASLRFDAGAEWIDIVLPGIDPSASHSYYVDFELASDQGGTLHAAARASVAAGEAGAQPQL